MDISAINGFLNRCSMENNLEELNIFQYPISFHHQNVANTKKPDKNLIYDEEFGRNVLKPDLKGPPETSFWDLSLSISPFRKSLEFGSKSH